MKSKRSQFVGRSIWRLDDSYEFILSETSKFIISDRGTKFPKTKVNVQPKTGLLLELGEWRNQ